jgi:mono/diheme cytochrome c family protein
MSVGTRLALALLLMAGPAAHAQQDAPPVDPAVAGRKVYVYSCQRCHGVNLATMGIGFDLRTLPKDDKARFVRSVTHGTDRGMPAWGSVLKPGQLDQLWAYIGSVNGWDAAPAGQ